MSRPWTVLPHGPLERLEENLLVVESALPRGGVRRRMSVVRLSDGRLVFQNAVPLAEPAMAEIDAFGRAAFLVVPNRFHRLDIHAWKARYPRCAVLCPRPAAKAVAAMVAVDGALDALPPDPALAVETLSGSKTDEAALVARSPDGVRASLLFGDAVMNIPHLPGLEGLLLRLIGSTGGPRVTRLARLVSVGDRRALAAHLERLAATPGLCGWCRATGRSYPSAPERCCARWPRGCGDPLRSEDAAVHVKGASRANVAHTRGASADRPRCGLEPSEACG